MLKREWRSAMKERVKLNQKIMFIKHRLIEARKKGTESEEEEAKA